ncbi:MAG: transcription-repair coupling factor [Bacteroidia bacterium]|nr:transcription-repair coupling factor [Bacteroidia bacterium]
MDTQNILNKFAEHGQLLQALEALNNKKHTQWSGTVGAGKSFLLASLFLKLNIPLILVFNDKEEAAYLLNDLENFLPDKKVFFFPSSYKKSYQVLETDNANILFRAEVLNALSSGISSFILITYAQALHEKVVTKNTLQKNTLQLKQGDKLTLEFVVEVLTEYKFERVDFVAEPGQFSVRGGIIDVFSFSNGEPYRIEFFGNEIESVRSFDIASQLSVTKFNHINIIPNVQGEIINESRETLFEFLPNNAVYFFSDTTQTLRILEKEFDKAQETYNTLEQDTLIKPLSPEELFFKSTDFISFIQNQPTIELKKSGLFATLTEIHFQQTPQPSFNKNFNLLLDSFYQNNLKNIFNILFTDSTKQAERIHTIIEDLSAKNNKHTKPDFVIIHSAVHQGFTDASINLACYTDHQIFERYHRFKLKEGFQKNKQAILLKELQNLQPGDFVTHIDHGVGRYAGLETMLVNGKQQEAVRIVYKDNDVLYVSVHSLHRISKFSGAEGTPPKLNKLGSQVWSALKQKTKKQVKDIAKELIALYAKRRASQGFACTPDTYLQHELEASFIYEDTKDQLKATNDVKRDLEKEYPMDRLICGDVGFGKTEVAIRAAFKMATEGKQVAILVPTTILASQHYKTFKERLKELPCKVDYLNRFKTGKQEKQTLEELASGKVDIIIGTHRIVSKDIKFKDLGLLIIDEEQKFGVSVKEKLKEIKVNVDTLTLTATPIPRTLQFSLLGARDLSVINTPPPNRFPVQTEVHEFNEELIRDAIQYELQRGGQVFFIHNRVQNITEIAGIIQRLLPDARIGVGHGQMDGKKLEQIMLDFVEGDVDVLVATTIIESGLDIPNANTILINRAENFGLSDLHQMRGRVGRSNKKAFCYLLTAPATVLTNDARKRLRTLEEFNDLGSGFNIAMRDMDIRGAGNLLGAEQSGFINEVGYETYQKILDEAISELKENEFQDLYKHEESEHKKFVRDCIVETDFELFFSENYIENLNERLLLYKQLDDIEDEEVLQVFINNLTDRFGELPTPAINLINLVRLRWIAEDLGFEKIIMKNNRFIGYLVSNQQSVYYQSDSFSKILKQVQTNRNFKIKENNQKPTITMEHISSVNQVLDIFKNILDVPE